MKSLADHNADRARARAQQSEFGKPRLNCIACPKCNHELWDSSPGTTLMSNPPQKNIECRACGFHGYRIA